MTIYWLKQTYFSGSGPYALTKMNNSLCFSDLLTLKFVSYIYQTVYRNVIFSRIKDGGLSVS